jgi:MFS family permease
MRERDGSDAPRRRWVEGLPIGLLVLVSAIVFVDTTFYTAITPLLPHYARTLHLGKSGAGLLVAAYPAGTLLAAIPGGFLASRVGVRPSVIAGLSLMSAATLTFGFSHEAWLLDLARFVQGIGGACTWAGGLAWLASGVEVSRRAAALGLAFSAAVGGALCGPVVGVLADSVGTGPAFAGATVASAVLIVASFLLRSSARAEAQSIRSVLVAIREPSILGGLWLTCLAGLALGVVGVLIPLRLSALGAGATAIGAIWLGAAAVEGVLSPFIGRVADRRGRAVPACWSVGLGVVSALVMPWLAPAAVLMAFVVLGLPVFGTLFVPAAAMTSDGADRQGLHLGLGFGLSNLAWAGGQAAASAGSGALAQVTGDLVPFLVLAAVFVATFFLLQQRSLLRSLLAPGRAT